LRTRAGAYDYRGKAKAVARLSALLHDGMFKNRDLRSELFVAHTNKIGMGAFRGFGNPDIGFALDQVLDRAAEELGIDPVELALKNVIDGETVSPHGQEIHSCELRTCIQRAAEMIGWKEGRANPTPNRGAPLATGISFARGRRFVDFAAAP